MSSDILVAIDFSARSDRALRRATMLAKQLGKALGLVHVVDDDQPRYLIDEQVRAARTLLLECTRTLDEVDGVRAWSEVVVGDGFAGILQVADRVDPLLIVLGPHRRQLRDIFVGTTAERTIARSAHPVLLVAGPPSAPPAEALVAIDMDEASKAALRYMLRFPIVPRAGLVAMHAYDVPAQGMMQRTMSPAEAIHHYVTVEKKRAEARLDELLHDLDARSLRRLLAPVNGRPGRTILEAAREARIPLVVVGTSQKRGAKRLLLGSAAEDVLGDADRDILVIPRHAAAPARPSSTGRSPGDGEG